MQTPGGNIANNLASFGNLFIRDGDGCDPVASANLLQECTHHVRSGAGPALCRLTVPRLCSHSGPDNQRGYRTEQEIADDEQRDPLPRLRQYLVPTVMSEQMWTDLEFEAKARRRGSSRGGTRAALPPTPLGSSATSTPTRIRKHFHFRWIDAR